MDAERAKAQMARRHTRKGWRDTAWRKHSPRGFTLLEVAVALGVFVSFAIGIASVTVSATSAHSQLRVRTNAVSALDYALGEVERASSYADMSIGQLNIPQRQAALCDPEADENCVLTVAEREALTRCLTTIALPNEGCILYGSSAVKVSYAAEPETARVDGSDETYVGSVRLFAEAFLPDGRQVRASRTVTPPELGTGGGKGYVDVILAGNIDGLYRQNILQGNLLVPLVPTIDLVRTGDGTTVTSTRLDVEERPARILMTVDVAENDCTLANPCRVEIDGGSYRVSDRYIERGGNLVVVEPGATTTVAVQLATGPGIVVSLETRPARDNTLLRSPEPGSVCIWGTFPHPDRPAEQVATSWCNINNPLEVNIRGWEDEGVERELPATADGEDGILLWVNPPVPAPVGQEVDCTPGTTPDNGIDQVDERMRLFGGTLWEQGETCTGWTWGMPDRIVFSELNERLYREGQTALPVYDSVDRRISLVWTPEQGALAAGCSPADPNWSYPRTAPAELDWDPAADAGDCATLLDSLKVAPQWTDTTLAAFAVGVNYFDQVQASGVPAPLYSISAGQLPTGISLNGVTGRLSGTPQAAGQFSFTIAATSAENVITQAYTITVTLP